MIKFAWVNKRTMAIPYIGNRLYHEFTITRERGHFACRGRVFFSRLAAKQYVRVSLDKHRGES